MLPHLKPWLQLTTLLQYPFRLYKILRYYIPITTLFVAHYGHSVKLCTCTYFYFTYTATYFNNYYNCNIQYSLIMLVLESEFFFFSVHVSRFNA